MLSRSHQLLDAAIDVLASRGMRQLTHRAVDAAAGLPVGSTSNRFRTREALLVGVLGRVLERETAAWTRLAIGIRTVSIEVVAGAIGALLHELTHESRALSQARRAVFVEAAHQPLLAAEIHRAQAEIGSWMGPLLADLGSDDPSRDVGYLLALMEGLIGNQLASPVIDFDPATAVAALLTGLIHRPSMQRVSR